MARAYGRAPSSERVFDDVPKNWGDSFTLIAGLSERALIAPMLIRRSLTGDAFVGYLRECVAPELRAGDVVVLDNLSAHKTEAAREVIEAAGATLLFLPPYSPDLNPIELAWAKIKSVIRGLRPRRFDELVEATAATLASVPAQDRNAWIGHALLQNQRIGNAL
jgi:transposase